MSADLDKFMNGLKRRNPGQPEFHQAVYEVAHTVLPLIEANPVYKDAPVYRSVNAEGFFAKMRRSPGAMDDPSGQR